MSQTPGLANFSAPHADRRLHPRQQVRALVYVKLDEGNGGIVLDLSEGGMSARAVSSLVDESLPCMRFQLSPSQGWIETAARVVWASDSKKVVGLEFAGLSPQERSQIREWLSQDFIPKRIARRREAASTERASAATAPAASESKLSAIPPAESQAVAAARQSVQETPALAPSPGVKLATMLDYTQALQPRQPGSASRIKTMAMNPVPSQWALLSLAVLLGTISLAGGWMAGRGWMDAILNKVREMASRDAPGVPYAAPLSARPVARVSQIEVVDTGNQQWVIPWVAPPIAKDKNRRSATPKNPSLQSRKDRPRFQTWALSPPLRASRAAGGTEPEKQSPPIPIGVSGNSEGLARSSALAEPPVVRPPALSEPKQAVSVLREGAVIHRVEPVYPALAQGQRIEGTVKLRATIGPDGIVRSVEVLGGPAPLVPAGAQAVRQWRYSPTLLNGTPINTTKDIDIVFRLRDSN
jgi:TonB family protein